MSIPAKKQKRKKEPKEFQFQILKEIEKPNISTDQIQDEIEFFSDYRKFLKEIRTKSAQWKARMVIKRKKHHELVEKYKLTKPGDTERKGLAKDIVKLVGEITVLRQKIKSVPKKIKKLRSLRKDFVKRIMEAQSPQELDIYIAAIEDAQNKMMGNPNPDKSPIYLTRFVRLLEKQEKEAHKKQQAGKGRVGRLVSGITSSKDSLAANVIAPYIPNSMEAWAHEEFNAGRLESDIKEGHDKIDIAFANILNKKHDKLQKELFIKKNELINTLIDYTENQKLRFQRRANYSSALATGATLLTFLTATANVMTFVPVVNLFAKPIAKFLEFTTYSMTTAANKLDPNVPPEEKLAAIRHYEAMKLYSRGETGTAAVGTLSLSTGLIAELAIAGGTLPFLAPGFLLAGATFMMVSNIISAAGSKKELDRSKELLKEALKTYNEERDETKEDENGNLKYKNFRPANGEEATLKWLRNIANNDFKSIYDNKDLPDDQKKAILKVLKADARVQSLDAQLKFKSSAAFGSGAATVLGIGVVLTIAGFPPLGAAVVTVLTVAAGISAAYSFYKRYKEKQKSKETFRLQQQLQTIEMREASEAITNKVELGVTDKPKPPAVPPRPDKGSIVRHREDLFVKEHQKVRENLHHTPALREIENRAVEKKSNSDSDKEAETKEDHETPKPNGHPPKH